MSRWVRLMSKRPISKPEKAGIVLRLAQLPHAEGLALPKYQTAGAAGFDLVAAVPDGKPLRLKAGTHALVPTGLVFELPYGFEAQVRPRSGLAFKHGVTVLNSPGTIDSDYRGEVGVILVNHGAKAFVIERGERIAQVVVAPVVRVELVTVQVEALQETARGDGGFGSTGTRTETANAPGKARSKAQPRAFSRVSVKGTPRPASRRGFRGAAGEK